MNVWLAAICFALASLFLPPYQPSQMSAWKHLIGVAILLSCLATFIAAGIFFLQGTWSL